MKSKYDWPKGPTRWMENRVLHVSIPFTWDLPSVRNSLMQNSLFNEWDRAIVGGPAAYLMPDYFAGMDHVSIGYNSEGVIQRVNPMATKTTTGCIRKCEFCAVPKIEGNLVELDDWPDLPVIMDNNLLAASEEHFDRVLDRLVKWRGVDFNQGLDARLLTKYHAERLSELKSPTIRLAFDSGNGYDIWDEAMHKLANAGVPIRDIRTYAMVGFDTGPKEAWERCEIIAAYGIKASLRWFHPLDAMKFNVVTEKQAYLGWTDLERKRIMQFFYQYKKKRNRHV
jgi:hypothetical protein